MAEAFDSVSRIGDSASVQAATLSERRANLEKDDVRADLAAVPGKADTVGRMSEDERCCV